MKKSSKDKLDTCFELSPPIILPYQPPPSPIKDYMSDQPAPPSQETREYVSKQFDRLDGNVRAIAVEHSDIIGSIFVSSVEIEKGHNRLLASVVGHPSKIMDMLHLTLDTALKAIFINVALDGDNTRMEDDSVKLAFAIFKNQLAHELISNAKGDFIENLKAKLGEPGTRGNPEFN